MWLTYTLGALVVAFVGINVVWRYASRRYQLPCPSSLSFLVAGGPLDRLAGTQQTLDRMKLAPGQRVLEIGPGPGRLLVPAAQRILPGGEAVGLELQQGMIAKLQRRAAQAGVTNLRVMQGDAGQPHDLQDFDRVYLCTVLGEIPDRQAALQNAFAALRPGGLLSITEIMGDPHYQSQAKVRALADSVGFRHVETHGGRLRFTMNFEKPVSAP